MYEVSWDTCKNYNTMESLIEDYGLSAHDILDFLTDWHGLQLLDEAFMKNLFDEIDIEYEEDV